MSKQLNVLMFKFDQPGDEITGTITKVEKDFKIPNSESGGTCDRYFIMDDEGVTHSFIMGTATDKSLEGVVLDGLYVNVKFEGKKSIAGGSKQANQFVVNQIEPDSKKKK